MFVPKAGYGRTQAEVSGRRTEYQSHQLQYICRCPSIFVWHHETLDDPSARHDILWQSWLVEPSDVWTAICDLHFATWGELSWQASANVHVNAAPENPLQQLLTYHAWMMTDVDEDPQFFLYEDVNKTISQSTSLRSCRWNKYIICFSKFIAVYEPCTFDTYGSLPQFETRLVRLLCS